MKADSLFKPLVGRYTRAYERGAGGDNDPGAHGVWGAHELERKPIQNTLRSERPIEIACEELYAICRSPNFFRKNRRNSGEDLFAFVKIT